MRRRRRRAGRSPGGSGESGRRGRRRDTRQHTTSHSSAPGRAAITRHVEEDPRSLEDLLVGLGGRIKPPRSLCRVAAAVLAFFFFGLAGPLDASGLCARGPTSSLWLCSRGRLRGEMDMARLRSSRKRLNVGLAGARGPTSAPRLCSRGCLRGETETARLRSARRRLGVGALGERPLGSGRSSLVVAV